MWWWRVKLGPEAGRAAEREPAVVPAQTGSGVQEREGSTGCGRAHMEGVRGGGEGGTSQGNCEKWGWESPLKMNGSVVPAFLMCILTLLCTCPNQNLRWEGQRSSQNEKVRPVYTFFFLSIHPSFLNIF